MTAFVLLVSALLYYRAGTWSTDCAAVIRSCGFDFEVEVLAFIVLIHHELLTGELVSCLAAFVTKASLSTRWSIKTMISRRFVWQQSYRALGRCVHWWFKSSYVAGVSIDYVLLFS